MIARQQLIAELDTKSFGIAAMRWSFASSTSPRTAVHLHVSRNIMYRDQTGVYYSSHAVGDLTTLLASQTIERLTIM